MEVLNPPDVLFRQESPKAAVAAGSIYADDTNVTVRSGRMQLAVNRLSNTIKF
jgi:hypothetical protein